MNRVEVPPITSYRQGEDFDWWRCQTNEYVGRPPSPFPAPFETPRIRREDSADSRYGLRWTVGTAGNAGCTRGATTPTGDATNGDATNGNATNGGATNGNATNGGATNGAVLHTNFANLTGEARNIYWPLCQGPELPEPDGQDDLDDKDLNSNVNRRSKTNPLPYKRPPWCPAKMPNKWGVAGHPPPYTNYCKETLFNTRTADPAKVSIKTTF